jgi:hypothetical protein
MVRLGENGVGSASVDDETQGVCVFADRKDTIDNVNRGLEGDHAKAREPEDELDVLGTRVTENTGASLDTSRHGTQEEVRGRIQRGQMRREEIEKTGCASH